jgi:hypothetical protein
MSNKNPLARINISKTDGVAISTTFANKAWRGERAARRGACADHDQWLPLWEGYNAFYKRVGPMRCRVRSPT